MLNLDPAELVFTVVKLIPYGKVVTYGQVADMVNGVRLGPRQVGSIMQTSSADVPWWRVVGAGGRVLTDRRSPHLGRTQRELLDLEHVPVKESGLIDMQNAQWYPDFTVRADIEGDCR